MAVIDDATPEVTEHTQFRITSIVPAAGTPTGLSFSAGIDTATGAAISTLVIQASDNPHGTFTFTDSTSVRVDPHNSTTLTLNIGRTGGSIGIVEVLVSSYSGRISGPTPALSNIDFVPLASSSVIFADGQTQATVTVTLLVDDAPHGDLLFELQLDSVALNPALPQSGALPSLGTASFITNVTIAAFGDNPGTFEFTTTAGSLCSGGEYLL